MDVTGRGTRGAHAGSSRSIVAATALAEVVAGVTPLSELADDTLVLLDVVGIGRATFVGLSMGRADDVNAEFFEFLDGW